MFLTVPDRDHTFDRHRKLTTQKHLWRDYQKGESTISNAHMRDFLRNKQIVDTPHPEVARYFLENGLPLDYYNGNKLPLNPFKRKRSMTFIENAAYMSMSGIVHPSINSFLGNQQIEPQFAVLNTHSPEDIKERWFIYWKNRFRSLVGDWIWRDRQ
ncbi:MAG: hypothetical protein CM1200mP20_09510 [Pseudomonadota bacterium]|nr:MAG: hypothetical protein CM1200mP20_09510 [Pseudomonadota bacterium]